MVPRRQRRPWAVSTGGSGPGLLALCRACQFRPLPRGSPAIPARRFDIRDSSVQSGPAQCQFRACGSGLSLQPPSLGPCQLCPTLGLLASPPAPPGQAMVRVHWLIRSQSSLCPALSVTEFMFRLNNLTPGAPGWALPRASRPRPPRPLAAGPPPLVAGGSPSLRDLPHTPLSRTPIWALTARPHSSNRAGGALGPEAELFAGAASRDVASMVVAAATSQNQQLRARQASGAAILGRCASPRMTPADRHLEEVSF